MNGIVELGIKQFGLIYLLLIIVLFVMKKCQIKQTKLLIVATLRMTLQLFLAGLILTHIFQYPHPAFTLLYLIIMTGFSVHMALSKYKTMNKRFKLIIALSLSATGCAILVFYIVAVVQVNLFNPQYTIPISGMIMGNAVKGVSLGLKTFNENIKTGRNKIDTLINMGVKPQKALLPFVNQAIETATLPTILSMTGMGIISLPGMMTGQMISGTLPQTAILYQISIIIAITAATCVSVFCSLYFGYRTLYNENNQVNGTLF